MHAAFALVLFCVGLVSGWLSACKSPVDVFSLLERWLLAGLTAVDVQTDDELKQSTLERSGFCVWTWMDSFISFTGWILSVSVTYLRFYLQCVFYNFYMCVR